MYFDPSTKSPISLLELGLYARAGKMIVCCPDGFWRKGNVDIVCFRHKIKQVQTLDALINMAIYIAETAWLYNNKEWQVLHKEQT